MHTILVKIQLFVKVCDISQRMRIKSPKNRPYHPKIPVDYFPIESLSVDMKFIPKGFDDFTYLFVATCETTHFVVAILISSQSFDS